MNSVLKHEENKCLAFLYKERELVEASNTEIIGGSEIGGMKTFETRDN